MTSPVGAIKEIKNSPNKYVSIITILEQCDLSANGEKTGIVKTANPDEDWTKIPRKIKIKNNIIAKITFGNPLIILDKEYNIVSDIFPSLRVIFIPLANPITKHTPKKSPAPLIKISILQISLQQMLILNSIFHKGNYFYDKLIN